MLKRQAILKILPKTRVNGFYRSDAFLIALIPVFLLVLTSCNQEQLPVTVKFYSTLNECIKDRMREIQCQEAYSQAQQKHLLEEPFYEQKSECERDTLEPCEVISTTQGITYKPIMRGFAVTQPQTLNDANFSSGGGIYTSYPVYGRSTGYRLGNGEPLRLSPNRTATVKPSTITRGFGSSFKSSTSRS